MTSSRPALAAALLAALAACSDDPEPSCPDCPPVDPLAACSTEEGLAAGRAVIAAQPTLRARSKTVRSVETTFPFAGVACPVRLHFKDLDGDGALSGYEDWRRPAAERAADLLGRMTAAEKLALLAHPALGAVGSNGPGLDPAVAALIDQGVRFGRVVPDGAARVGKLALGANAIQEAAEATRLGVPFVLSLAPVHAEGGGRDVLTGFSRWPLPLGLAASRDEAQAEAQGRVVAREYRAVGVRVAFAPSADLFTEPRWWMGQHGFGEDAAGVGALAAAFVRGLQGDAIGATSVAAVVGSFPGAGATEGGADGRTAAGRHLAYPGGAADLHLSAFEPALAAGAAGVVTAYGIPKAGAWSALGGLLQGATVEQVGAPYHAALLGDALRGRLGFGGLVVSPEGAVVDAAEGGFVAAWGMESAALPARLARAVNAGVDQVGGLADPAPLAEARSAGLIAETRVDEAAGRGLALAFRLGLFEDPYVDPTVAAEVCDDVDARIAARGALAGSVVLLVNAAKPAGFLNGNGDGTQLGDPFNAGNGSGRVLPAPPGNPYLLVSNRAYFMGDFDLDYVRSVSAGYTLMMNDVSVCADGTPAPTAEQRVACSDYVFVRLGAPYEPDPATGALGLPTGAIEWGGAAPDALADLAFARAALDAAPGARTQLVVVVDAGRPPALHELAPFEPSAVLLALGADDRAVLDVAFGIVSASGALPVGLPLDQASAEAQAGDLPADGQHATFVRGFGLATRAFY